MSKSALAIAHRHMWDALRLAMLMSRICELGCFTMAVSAASYLMQRWSAPGVRQRKYKAPRMRFGWWRGHFKILVWMRKPATCQLAAWLYAEVFLLGAMLLSGPQATSTWRARHSVRAG